MHPNHPTPKQILLVEDDPDITLIIKMLLEEKGHHVHALPTIDPQKANALKADLIILDQKLGEQLGSELCRQLKNDPASGSIPVILCSAVNELPELYAQCRADAFIPKPFSIDEFITQVEALLPDRGA